MSPGMPRRHPKLGPREPRTLMPHNFHSQKKQNHGSALLATDKGTYLVALSPDDHRPACIEPPAVPGARSTHAHQVPDILTGRLIRPRQNRSRLDSLRANATALHAEGQGGPAAHPTSGAWRWGLPIGRYHRA